MSAFGRAALRSGLTASAAVLAIALGAGLIRLLPWLLAPDVPLRVALPFASALAAAAIETSILIGMPVGFALAAAQAVDRGELRALAALGVSPLGFTLASVKYLVLAGAVAFGAMIAWDADASLPGRFARQLVQQARTSCAAADEPRTVLVPLVNVTWLCFPGHTPRVTGALPGFGERAWFTAAALEPSDDLRQLSLSDLRIATRKTEQAPALRLHVAQANVSGLASWGRPAKLGSELRALLVTSSAALLAIGAAWVVSARELASRAIALAIGAASTLSALAALHSLDKGPLPNVAYLLVPAAGMGALAALVLLERGVRRLVAGRQR